jgi:hypothetical protein
MGDGTDRFPPAALSMLRHVVSFRFPSKDTTPLLENADMIPHPAAGFKTETVIECVYPIKSTCLVKVYIGAIGGINSF